MKMHEHLAMTKHGEERDAGHRFGGIMHAHAHPIDLDDEKHKPRKGLDNPLPSAYNEDNTNQEGDSP